MIEHRKTVKAVGYWRVEGYPPDVLVEFSQLAQIEYRTRLPDPQDFVDPL